MDPCRCAFHEKLYTDPIKPETCFYTTTPFGEQDWQKYRISVCKLKDVKGCDEKVTNRRGKSIHTVHHHIFYAVHQDIQPCFYISPKQTNKQPSAWLNQILIHVSRHRIKKSYPEWKAVSSNLVSKEYTSTVWIKLATLNMPFVATCFCNTHVTTADKWWLTLKTVWITTWVW